MKANESKYSDVAVERQEDRKSDERYFWEVRAWETNEDDENATVVAKINLRGEVQWLVSGAKDDPKVNDELECFFDYNLFSMKDADTMVGKIASAISHAGSNACRMWDVINPAGVVRYGYEKLEIMGDPIVSVGSYGNGNHVEFDADEESVRKAAEWLVNDITEAVGEVFVIELN